MQRAAFLFFTLVLIAAAACREIPEEDHGICELDEFGCLEVGHNEPLVLGTLLDQSGRRKDVGAESRNGVLLASDYIDGSFDGENATLFGHPIELVHKDDRCSVDNEGDRELALRKDDLAGVIGTTCDAPALGVADVILGDEGIPLISPSATNPNLVDPQLHQPFFFRTAHNAELEIYALARFAVEELRAKTAATVRISSVESVEVTRFEESFTDLGGSITHTETIELGQKDFDAEIDSIFHPPGVPPDVLFLPVRPEEAFRLTSQARIAGVLRGVDLVTTSSLMTAYGDRGPGPPGSYVAVPDLHFGGRFYENQFLPAYRARFGEPGPGYHALAFDATMMLLKALKSVAIQETDGPTLFPRTALRDALATAGRKGISGALDCNEFGDCNLDQPMLVQHILTGRGQTVWSTND